MGLCGRGWEGGGGVGVGKVYGLVGKVYGLEGVWMLRLFVGMGVGMGGFVWAWVGGWGWG